MTVNDELLSPVTPTILAFYRVEFAFIVHTNTHVLKGLKDLLLTAPAIHVVRSFCHRDDWFEEVGVVLCVALRTPAEEDDAIGYASLI